MKETKSTCPYCGVGCGVVIEHDGTQITGVRGDPDHPANFGRLCTKGTNLHLTATPVVIQHQRLREPMRRATRSGQAETISWAAANREIADKLLAIRAEHGPESIGIYISGQLLTEDYHAFNKLARAVIGTPHIDSNSRLCMSSAVVGYKQALGADAPPCSYEDIELADCVLISGANPAWAHPILFRRLEAARANKPGHKLIVIDPRRTETAELADLHLQIRPGTDVALCHGLLHAVIWQGWTAGDFIANSTEGFDALKELVRDWAPSRAAQVCGVKEADIWQAAEWFATSPSSLSLYCQGLNQSSSGTAKNTALINLHLATGQIGKPGAGPFSLTGQPNAMGGREVGGMANLLSAHRDLSKPEHRAEVAQLWGVADVPATPGKTAVEMFEAAADGQVRALWISCTNPAQSMPDQTTVRRALERAEFVIVQEAFGTTATCEYADLLLPATTWGEKDGSVTNSERRISRVRPAIASPGETRHDWAAVVDFAQRLEKRLRPGLPTLFPYDTPESVWNEHRESTRGRDLDITGLSYAQLDEAPAQWPFPQGAVIGRERLYEDGVFPTANGRAKFADVAYEKVSEPRDARYPVSLTTGRLRDQWHGMSRTGTVGRLFGHVPEPSIEMNPQDLARMKLAEGDLVHVTSRRGMLVLPVQASEQVATTQAFIAMHWGEEYVSGSGGTGARITGVNALTTPAFCPQSKQPELKHTAVKVLKAELPWRLLGVAWLPDDKAVLAREQLKAMMSAFAFASCVPFGRERSGVLFRAAAYEAAPDELVARIEGVLGLGGEEVLHYADKRRGQRRTMRLAQVDDKTQLEGFVLAGDISAEAWIKPLLQDELPAQTYGRLLLVPGARAPVAVQARGKQVCTCFNVAEPEIASTLQSCDGTPEQQLAQLQNTLKCGTNCGSCIPELKRLVRNQMRVA